MNGFSQKQICYQRKVEGQAIIAGINQKVSSCMLFPPTLPSYPHISPTSVSPWNERHLFHERKAMTNLDSIWKSKDITPKKIHIVKVMVFPVVMWELDHKDGWAPKNWCFQTVVLEDTFEGPLDCKEIKLVNPKGNQPWIFTGRTDAEASILWPPDTKNWLTGKDPDAGKDWGQEGKGATEDEMVKWHHQLNGHEFEQTPGDGKGQGSLACCSPQGHKELEATERLNNDKTVPTDVWPPAPACLFLLLGLAEYKHQSLSSWKSQVQIAILFNTSVVADKIL